MSKLKPIYTRQTQETDLVTDLIDFGGKYVGTVINEYASELAVKFNKQNLDIIKCKLDSNNSGCYIGHEMGEIVSETIYNHKGRNISDMVLFKFCPRCGNKIEIKPN
jgi:hypothetical protein